MGRFNLKRFDPDNPLCVSRYSEKHLEVMRRMKKNSVVGRKKEA